MDLAQKIEEKNWALERAQVMRTSRPKPSGDGAGFFRTGDYYGLKKSMVIGNTGSGSNWTPPKLVDRSRRASEMTRTSYSQSGVSVNKDQDNIPSQTTRKHDGFRKKISNAEMQRPRERGLCFWCEEKWQFSHVCKNPQLQVLIATVNEEDRDKAEARVEEELGEPTVE